MNCNCKEQIESILTEDYKSKKSNQKNIVKSVDLTGYKDDEEYGEVPVIPYTINVDIGLTNGGYKPDSTQTTILASYCQHCGTATGVKTDKKPTEIEETEKPVENKIEKELVLKHPIYKKLASYEPPMTDDMRFETAKGILISAKYLSDNTGLDIAIAENIIYSEIGKSLGIPAEKETGKKVCLKLDMRGQDEAGKEGHPEEVMSFFGIKYEHAIPQSVGDQWWFIDCEYDMDLPSYITIMEFSDEEREHWFPKKPEDKNK